MDVGNATNLQKAYVMKKVWDEIWNKSWMIHALMRQFYIELVVNSILMVIC